MSESQGAGTAQRKVAPADPADPAEAYAAGLEAAVLQGLGIAIGNAVEAQQQLYVAGQAAFASALVHRLSGDAEPAERPAETASPPPANDLASLRDRLKETLTSGQAQAAGTDPAEVTRSLMTAFAESLDLLSAVHAQQMMGYVRVLVALGFDYDGQELGPAAAKAFEEVFDGDALVQLLADLAAARHAVPKEPGPR